MSYGNKHEKRKARKIEEYMAEYRRETGLPEEEGTAGAGDPPGAPESSVPGGESSLLEVLSHQERDAFDPALVRPEDELPIPPEDTEGEKPDLYRLAVKAVLEAIRLAQQDHVVDPDPVESLVGRLADSLEGGPDLLLVATDRAQRFAVSTHCVNVALFALRISQAQNHAREKQIRVGLAGLLHEVGVVRLTRRAVHQEGAVDPEVRQRPAHSARILKGLGPRFQWLVKTVGQVYEREDGSGFPRGLKGDEIREEAKILAIADVLDACIHDRPYRDALTGYQLFYELTAGRARGFSDQVVKAALKAFSLYPYNEYVTLNTGEVGRVVGINPTNRLRPRILVLYGSQGEKLEEPREVDLEQHPSTNITAAIPFKRLPR